MNFLAKGNDDFLPFFSIDFFTDFISMMVTKVHENEEN